MSSAQSDAEWAEQDREAEAAELSSLRDAVIAKDAEIAELRARAHMLGSELREADLRAESYLQERSKAVAERDEARVWVAKLWREGSAMLIAGSGREDFGSLAAVIDETPEHLR